MMSISWALDDARRIVDWDDAGRLADDEWLVERNDAAIIAIARALLSTSAAERGLREALKELVAVMDEAFPALAKSGLGPMERARAALFPEGEDELTRGQGRSAPISTDTKDTTR